MKRKILSIALAAALLSGGAAEASFDMTLKNGVVGIKGKTEPANKITVLAIKKGASASELGSVYKMLDFYADDKGAYGDSFKIVTGEDRTEVDLYVREGSADKLSKSFVYISEEKLGAFYNEIKNACSDASGAALKALLDKSGDEMIYAGFDCSEYDKLTDELKKTAAAVFVSEKPADNDAMIKAFDKGMAAALANTCGENGFAGYLEKYHEIIIGDELYQRLLADDKLKMWCGANITAAGAIKSAKDVEDALLCGEALYKINNCAYNELDKLLKENEALLGIKEKYSAYESLSESNKAKAAKTAVASLTSKPARTADELVLAILSAAEEFGKKTSSGGGGGGGSSSGKKSTSGSTILVGTGTTVDFSKKEEDSFTPKSDISTDDSGKVVNNFGDVSEDFWAKDAIYAMRDKKIISGFEDNTFRPNDKLTREQFVVMAAAAFGIRANGNVDFDDVADGAWYADAVKKAYNAGIISGISENKFGTGQYVTRQDMAVILSRIIEKQKLSIEDVRSFEGMKDVDSIAEYARESIESLYKKGIISGSDGNINPNGFATRAEAAVMIYNILNGGVGK